MDKAIIILDNLANICHSLANILRVFQATPPPFAAPVPVPVSSSPLTAPVSVPTKTAPVAVPVPALSPLPLGSISKAHVFAPVATPIPVS